jgi:hypothetical protein
VFPLSKRSRSWTRSILSIGVVLVSIIVCWAGTSSALVRTYILSSNSGLNTLIANDFDPLTATGETPTWTDGNLATPPVSYGEDSPATTQNRLRLEFSEISPGIVDPNGTVTIQLLDFFHDIDASIAPFVFVTGLGDFRYSGATGTLNGALEVSSWSTPLVGQAHVELYCEEAPGGGICGSASIPPHMTLEITHSNASVLDIDTAGVPDATSLNMTFSESYEAVYMEITIDQSFGRQYYSFTSSPVELPTAGEFVHRMLVGLLALAGFCFLSQSSPRCTGSLRLTRSAIRRHTLASFSRSTPIRRAVSGQRG